MSVGFKYRPRRTGTPFQVALIGSTVEVDEKVEYVLSFPTPCSPAVIHRLTELGAELVSNDTAVVSFINFVGVTDVAGITIKVISTKFGEGGVSRILEEVSHLASSLIFGWHRPIHISAAEDLQKWAPVQYHQLQYLRWAMLNAKPGERFQDWMESIERSPTRRFEPERVLAPPNQVRKLDHRALKEAFSRLERMIPVGQESGLKNNHLAKALTFGQPPTSHFPAKISSPHGRLSFDTPENRFVKHVISDCLALVFRFLDHPNLHNRLQEDCRQMLGILVPLSHAHFLDDAGIISAFHAPSQALIKAEGYRQLFAFWSAIRRHVSLPTSTAETQRLLEGRDMATLYEYWVFVKILETVVTVTGRMPVEKPQLYRNELGEKLTLGVSVYLGDHLRVRYNPTFMRSARTAYSTPLRPDVTVEVGNQIYAFDAKYRMEYLDAADSDVDDEATTYKRSDLYKMHTYRDAIKGIRAAFIVYPGTEFVFFEKAGDKRTQPETIVSPDGVGALPLRPADAEPAVKLQSLLCLLLNSNPSSAI